jgi:peroxiredoxin Q/BCP
MKGSLPFIDGSWTPLFILSILFLTLACATSEGEDSMNAKQKVQVGYPAPDFSLPDQKGEWVSLKNFKGNSAVVLYFYPKNNTSVCTAQACSFRDSYESFTDAGAEVIGISSDSVESHQGFAAEHRLPFHILSDDDGKIRKLYGATALLGIPGRVTYVIDKEGIIRHKFSSMFSADAHIEEALEILSKIQ